MSTRKRRSLRGESWRRWWWPTATITVAVVLILLPLRSRSPSLAPALSAVSQKETEPEVNPIVPRRETVRGAGTTADAKPPQSGWEKLAPISEQTVATAPVRSDPESLLRQIEPPPDAMPSAVHTTARPFTVTTRPAPSAVPVKSPPSAKPKPAENEVSDLLTRAQDRLEQGNALEARRLINEVLNGHGERLSPAQAGLLQSVLNRTHDRLMLSRTVVPTDVLVDRYRVKQGDMLSMLGIRYKVPYSLIKRVNGLRRDRDLRADSKIKIPRGPFHVVIDKSVYRMDVYGLDPKGKRLYVCSYPVGLGADGSTPSGRWVVARGKIENPDWRNPVTGRYYSANDKENPIGEHWIPLRGVDARTQILAGYGIHGTIEPQSIGSQSSMGCVRLRPAEIEQIFHLLTVGHSQVEIRP